ncbi:hypothetical protein HZQ11_15725 [Elizabethkingia anophelis]|uniref:hypothetical protein n=1 Tax=Elizabethkingia TaxID=308865 RepID=UPI000B110535|nr:MULTISPECIES: hypothetical protein [Elizabethkingia]MCT3645513.1 hypothetical protein [Elizabethkingia anophelis]MCT3652506.1 hypothetical protein [Elizabethkingia anophelis]MCT3656680.1 hypothetical protein [Elizabethkingia anophelis]MCT3659773.1 hypothetical protein [Elizabethkingia anophelis]MCT3666937.1 hypothetical protein [Elizabethkingia anophelis]
MKKFKILLFCGSIFFINACRSDQQNTLDENIKGINFNINIDSFVTTDTNKQANTKADISTNLINKQELISDPFSIVSELAPERPGINKNTSVTPRSISGSNVKFRILAYDSQTGDYVAQDTGTPASVAAGQKLFANINLVGNKKYTFVTYSFNSTTEPPQAPTTNLNQAKLHITDLNGKEAGTDLLYAINKDVLISGGNTNINVVLKHKFSKITISVDANDATGTFGQSNYVKGGYVLDNNAAGFTGTILDCHTSCNLNLKDARISEGDNQVFSVSNINTTPQAVIVNTGGENAYKSQFIIPSGAIVIGKDINTDPVSIPITGPGGMGLQPGKSYTLKLKFNSDRYTDMNGITATKATGGYVVIGGYRWARFNLGVTETNPVMNNPDAIPTIAKIYGAKYQWGIRTNTPLRYLSQITDQSINGSILNWATQPLTDKWNMGTEENPIRTDTDPCTDIDFGNNLYRVPTQNEFQKLISNTIGESVGTQSTNSAVYDNYSYGRQYISKKSKNILLTLPASGYRFYNNGTKNNLGRTLNYWVSTTSTNNNSVYFSYSNNSNPEKFNNTYRVTGMSIRCIQN